MSNRNSKLSHFIDWCNEHGAFIATLFLILFVTLSALWLRSCLDGPEKVIDVGITHSTGIDLTPAQIRSIERIGKWEFLAVADEEMIDTVRRRLIGQDDRLVRIYKGTLRLGLNMEDCREGWLQAHGDTVTAVIPKIGLLSEHFIDEARTRAFYENGNWDARAKEALYHKAARAMKRRCLTPANIHKAEANAREQLTALFRAFGFNHVEIRFETDQ